jgi:hypothetical protein
MGILIKHSGNPSATAVAAFGAGQGKRRQQVQDDQLRMIQREGEATISSNRAVANREDVQDFQSEQTDLARQAAVESQATAFQNTRENMRLNADLQGEMADEAQARRRDDFEWEYTETQRRQVAQMEEGWQQAVDSGEYTNEELGEIRNQIDAKQIGIKPIKRLKKKSPFPTGQGIGEVWNSPDGGIMFTRDKDGNVKKIGETHKNPTWKDRIEARKMFVEQFEGADGKVDYEAVEQAMGEMFKGAEQEADTASPALTNSAQRFYDKSGRAPATQGQGKYTEQESALIMEDVAKQVDADKANKKLEPEARSRKVMDAYFKKVGELAPVAGIPAPSLSGVKGPVKDALAERWNSSASKLQTIHNEIVPRMEEWKKAKAALDGSGNHPKNKKDFDKLDTRLRLDLVGYNQMRESLQRFGGTGGR